MNSFLFYERTIKGSCLFCVDTWNGIKSKFSILALDANQLTYTTPNMPCR